MKLMLIREPTISDMTFGSLYVDKVWECWTLEDAVRDIKISGKTAIPKGWYKIVIDDSVRFKRKMPHLLNVPNFDGVRIHSGNSVDDTEGCILVGKNRQPKSITQSIPAFNLLFDKMSKSEILEIEITEL